MTPPRFLSHRPAAPAPRAGTTRVPRAASPQPTRQGEQLGRALRFIDTHLGAALDASTLAAQAAMSPHHFHRVFHAHVGCSVGTFVTWRRLQRACALLVSGDEPVLDIALAVGFESAQALAKAMRRDLGTIPTDVRRGDATPWTHLLRPRAWGSSPLEDLGDPLMTPTRSTRLPAGLVALTATAHGMVDRTLTRAAQQAFSELMTAVGAAGLMGAVRSRISICPDDPQGPDDPDCRYIAGVLFGHAMADGEGACERPLVPLSGSLAWADLSPGRYAVFTHHGPYTTLYRTWDAIYRDWLPASGEALRDDPPLELCITMPDRVPPEKLVTEIWIPVQG